MKRGELGGVQAASQGAVSRIYSFFGWFLKIARCVCVCGVDQTHATVPVEVRGQLARFGSLLPWYGL